MLLIHFRRLTASREEYLANLWVHWVHMSSGCGHLFLLLAARTWTHTEPPNATGEETVLVYSPTGDSIQGPLVYHAITELKSHTHCRPVTISIYLIRFIPESTGNHAGTDQTVPVLPAAQTLTHTDPQNVKGEGKLPIVFTLTEDRTHDPLHANPNLYRAAIKAVLYHKAVKVCVIYLTLLHILASIVSTYRLLLLVHFKSVRFVFSITVKLFRDGSPVCSLMFGDAKRRRLDWLFSDLIKRNVSHLDTDT